MWFTLRPLPESYARTARHTFVMERELETSAEALFALLADAEAWPKWFPDMRRVTWLSPEGERARVDAVRRADTGSGDVIEHFVVWDAPRRFAFYAERMSTPLVSEFFEDYEITPLGPQRSKLRWVVAFEPRLVFRPLMFAIRPRFAAMFDGAADALVAYVKRTR